MRDLLVAFSGANLVLLAVWRRLLLASPGERFWMRIPDREDALAAILNLILLGTALYGLLRLARQAHEGVVRHVLCASPALMLLIPLSTVFGGNGPLRLFGHYGLWVAYAGALAVGTSALYRWRNQVAVLLLVFSPFVLFTFGQAAWMASRPTSIPAVTSREPERSGRAGPRVVMIVFDEMEQRLAFEQRPAGLDLPNFDRLRAESWVADRALPPGDGTHVSIPSLLTGRQVVAAQPQSASQLFIRYQDGKQPQHFEAEPHLFRSLHGQGIRSAVVGWHLPYCRMFREYLASCFSQPRRDPAPRKNSVPRAMLKQLESLFYLFERSEHIVEYETLLEHSINAVEDPTLDFVYLHLPVPHGPPIYDRSVGRLTIWNLSDQWYSDNLALADAALGQLRSSMERAGVWNDTAVVLTSDHVWLLAHKYADSRDDRVPFLVRLPGATGGQRYPAEMQAIQAPTVVEGILSGQIATMADLARTVERR